MGPKSEATDAAGDGGFDVSGDEQSTNGSGPHGPDEVPWPSKPTAAIVPGFTWEQGDKLCAWIVRTVRGQAVGGFEEVLPFNVVPVRALREGRAIKVVEVDVVFVSGRIERVSLPATVISVNRPAPFLATETGLDLSHREANALAQFVSVICTEQSTVEVDEVLTVAEWREDDLRVPGRIEVSPRKAFAELGKYGGTRGTEDGAREAWLGALQIAVNHPKLLLALGMPLGSIYAARLRQPPHSLGTSTFALHLTGDSAKGKTQAAIAAMSTLGDATEKSVKATLYRTWNLSAQAPVALAHQLGVLPILLDEAATSDKTPEEFTEALFNLAQGTERQRATVTGDLDEVERWECCVLSTGEMRLTGKSGLTGVRRRVQELYAPFADQSSSDDVFKRATGHYGWPLKWIAENPDVETGARLLLEVETTFTDQITWLNAAAVNMAVCGLGALMLARYLGVPQVTTDAVRAAVRHVVEKMGREAVEEGVDAGTKLQKAVWDASIARSYAYPKENEFPLSNRDREGVRFADGTVGVLSRSALKRIAEDAGLPDYQAGVRLLKDNGMMDCDPGRDQIRRSFCINKDQKEQRRIYVFFPLTDRDL
jgi:hypothetical protein